MNLGARIRLLWSSLKEPIPPMEGYLKQHMTLLSKIRERFYTFLVFKFFGVPVSLWGASRLGGLHGKYNWPPAPLRPVRR